MKPLFIKKNGTVSKVSGIIMNLIPSYTMAEYNALTHKPLLWVRTDEDYAQIPSEDVSYGSGSVEDALDEANTKLTQVDTMKGTLTSLNYTSDLYPLSLENGAYTISNVSTSYVPYQWGCLVVMGSANYGVCFFIATVGNTYSRSFSKLNNSWYTEWKQL